MSKYKICPFCSWKIRSLKNSNFVRQKLIKISYPFWIKMCNFTIEDFEKNPKFYFNTGDKYVCSSCQKPIGDHKRAEERHYVMQNCAIKKSDIVYAVVELDGVLKIKHKNGETLTLYYDNSGMANIHLKALMLA